MKKEEGRRKMKTENWEIRIEKWDIRYKIEDWRYDSLILYLQI